MKKRIFTILITLLIFVFLLASCGSDVPQETTAADSITVPDTTVEKTQPIEENIVLFAPGVCEYRIVYPSDDTDDEFSSARNLQQLIEEKCGVKPELVRSNVACGENYDPNIKEIYLSFVDTVEFDMAIGSVSYTTGVCTVIGNKIVVTGHEREGFKDAYNHFVQCIEKNIVDGKCILNSSFWSSCESSNNDYKKFAEVPGYPGGKIDDISLLGNGYTQVTISDTNADMYEAYQTVLTADGYSLYSENEIADNTYSTYTRGKEMLYYYYSPNLGETRVIIAKDVNLPSTEEVQYTKVCEPAFICLRSLNDSGAVSGDSQGCIIRFADGTFMIYDGGNMNSHQAKQIYEVLLKYAPDPQNVIVRAWVFSHYHGDHVGAFRSYVERYKNSKVVTIESFIYNFCNTKEQTETFSPGQMPAVESAINTLNSKAPVYKCLTGQVYRFPGMDMEILACMSDFIPLVIGYERYDADKTKGDGNSMSTVVRLLTPEGNTCMLTGDSTNIVLDCMVDRYGAEYLDSDIVTTPHHAHNRDSYRARNATIKFYDAVKPEILVVTSPNLNKFVPTASYPYEVNVHVLTAYDPELYLMNELRLISLSTLKEIK